MSLDSLEVGPLGKIVGGRLLRCRGREAGFWGEVMGNRPLGKIAMAAGEEEYKYYLTL